MTLQRQEEKIEFEVPDWARKKFDSELRRFCFEELNWDGICPPEPPNKGFFRK